jgi:molybdate/tungstate transport system substrate-binding protein
MQDEGVDQSRRAFLRGAGTAGLFGVAGCLGDRGTGSGDDRSRETAAGGSETPVSILAAGSLQHAIETGLEPALDVPVRVEAHGSATVARLIAEGKRDPDIVTVADTALFESPLSPPWHAVFTSNSIVLAYNAETAGGERVADAAPDRWWEPLLADDVRLGRTDPDQDPLGYRTLFTLELASRYYDDAANLDRRIPRRRQLYPETALVSQFETGPPAAAVPYRPTAADRGYDQVTLPAQVDLSDPAYADEWYRTVSYTLPSGQEIRGGLISYGSTIRTMNEATLRVFDRHTTGGYLDESGFLRRDGFPRYEGSVPEAVREATRHTADPRASRAGGPTPTADGAGRR